MEDFHKALKTGLRAERLQLETAERLLPAVAVMSVVAVRLVGLREQLRHRSQNTANQSGLDALSLTVLRAATHQPVNTVGEVALAVARLGGHLNRRRDGPPGWQALWQGMQKLDLLVRGVLLSSKLLEFG